MESVSQSSLKKHRKFRAPEGDFDFDDPSTTSLNHSEVSNEKELKIGRLNPEKFAWILAGFVVAYFSKFHLYLLPSGWPQSTWRLPLWTAYASFICFLCIFVYLNYYLPFICGIKITAKHWKRDAPIAVPSATISGSFGFILLCVGFLPHYHLWSLLIFPTLFMSFFALISLF